MPSKKNRLLGIYATRRHSDHETESVWGHCEIGNVRRLDAEIDLGKSGGFHWEIDASLKDESQALFMQRKLPNAHSASTMHQARLASKEELQIRTSGPNEDRLSFGSPI